MGSFGPVREGHFIECRRRHYHKQFTDGLEKTAEESALKLTSEIDRHALMWLLQCCEDDEMLKDFFSCIPGLCYSKVVDVARTFSMSLREKMTEALLYFVHCTLTLIWFAQNKRWHLDICKAVMKIAPLRVSWQIFHHFVNAEWDSLLNSIEFAHLLRGGLSAMTQQLPITHELCSLSFYQEHRNLKSVGCN